MVIPSNAQSSTTFPKRKVKRVSLICLMKTLRPTTISNTPMVVLNMIAKAAFHIRLIEMGPNILNRVSLNNWMIMILEIGLNRLSRSYLRNKRPSSLVAQTIDRIKNSLVNNLEPIGKTLKRKHQILYYKALWSSLRSTIFIKN